MTQKEALTDATHAPTSVLDDHLLTEGIDALKVSYVRIYFYNMQIYRWYYVILGGYWRKCFKYRCDRLNVMF